MFFRRKAHLESLKALAVIQKQLGQLIEHAQHIRYDLDEIQDRLGTMPDDVTSFVEEWKKINVPKEDYLDYQARMKDESRPY